MRVLIVAATPAEAAPIAIGLAPTGMRSSHHVDVLITGVGMVAAAAKVTRALAQHPYDLALNVGVCGSFDPDLPPGTAVHVVSDCLPELGAEDADRFIPAV